MPPYDATAEPDLLAADEGGAAVQPIVATDGELLMAFSKHRDEAAFAQLVDRHAPLVWSVCRQVLGNRADVEDAFQATFLILATRAKAIRASDSAAAWLYRVAHRTAIALWRDRRKRDTTPLNGHDVVGPEVNPLERLGEQHAVTVLVEELRTLPEKYQSPLVLCYLEGLSRSAAAEALDCTTAAVKGRLARGRRMLRERLARRGVALSVAAAAAATGVASAQTVVASSSVGAATAAAATGYVSSASSASGTVALAPQVTSLVQQGASAMFYASFAKPVLALVAVVAVGVATAFAIDEPIPEPSPSGDFALQATAEMQGEAGESLDSALSVTTPLASSSDKDSSAGEDASNGDVDTPTLTTNKQNDPVRMEFAETDSGEDIMVLRGEQQSVLAAQQKVMQLMQRQQAQPQQLASAQPLDSQSQSSVAALELAQKHWELRAKGLRAKAKAIKAKVSRRRVLNESGAVTQAELAGMDELLADATLLEADAFLAEAKGMELKSQIEQRKQQPLPAQPRVSATDHELFEGPAPNQERSIIQPMLQPSPYDSRTEYVHSPLNFVSADDAANLEEARNRARSNGKLVLVHFLSLSGSRPCRDFLAMSNSNRVASAAISKNYVSLDLDVGGLSAALLAKHFGINRTPTVLVLSAEGNIYEKGESVLEQFTAPSDAKEYAEKLNQIAMQHAPNRQQRPSHAPPTPVGVMPPTPAPSIGASQSFPEPSLPSEPEQPAAPPSPAKPVASATAPKRPSQPRHDPPRRATGWQQGPPPQPQTRSLQPQSTQPRRELNSGFFEPQPAASEQTTLRDATTDPPRFRDAPQPRSGDPFAPKPDDRPLQPGDSLQVDIRQQWPIPAQIAHQVRLGGGGHLSMAGLDKALKLDGLTLEEAKVAINKALAEQHGEKFQHVGLSATVRRAPDWENREYSFPTLIPTTGQDGRPNPAAYRSSPAPQPQPYPSESPYTPSLSSPSPAG